MQGGRVMMVVGALALTVAACGGDDGGSGATTTTPVTTAAPPTAAPTTVAPTAEAPTTTASTTVAAPTSAAPGTTTGAAGQIAASVGSLSEGLSEIIGIEITPEITTCLSGALLQRLTPEQLQQLASLAGTDPADLSVEDLPPEVIDAAFLALADCVGTDEVVGSLAALLEDPDYGVDTEQAKCLAEALLTEVGFSILLSDSEEPPQEFVDAARGCGIDTELLLGS